MGVRERHFTTRLCQRGNFIGQQNIVRARQEGLRRAVDRVLATTPNLHDQDRLYFTLSSNRLTNNFQGWGLRAGEWREAGARLDALFDRLAQALNSNEQFEMDDSCQLSITQVHHAPQGRGKPRQTKPGHPALAALTLQKRSVIRIQNADELCCPRALVVAKAHLDQHPKWESIRKGGPLQSRPVPIVLVKCWKVAHWNAKKLLKNCQKSKKLLPKFQKLLPKFLAIFI